MTNLHIGETSVGCHLLCKIFVVRALFSNLYWKNLSFVALICRKKLGIRAFHSSWEISESSEPHSCLIVERSSQWGIFFQVRSNKFFCSFVWYWPIQHTKV